MDSAARIAETSAQVQALRGMTDDAIAMLTELPEKPTGWTKHLIVHLNFGPKGGAASYEIRDDQGRKTNVGYAYDTRKTKTAPKGVRGFYVGDSELMSWKDLRARYAELTAKS